MYKLLPLLGDLGLGIISVVCVSFVYGKEVDGAFVLLALAFLPDLDALPELWRHGQVAASKDHPADHRELLHKPILWLGVAGFCWWYFGYYGAVSFVVLLLHFVHDSVLTGWGVPWLWPFSKVRIKFFVDEKNEVSLAPKNWIRTWNKLELQHAIVIYGNKNWIEDLYLRPTVVSAVEYGIFLLSLVALLVV